MAFSFIVGIMCVTASIKVAFSRPINMDFLFEWLHKIITTYLIHSCNTLFTSVTFTEHIMRRYILTRVTHRSHSISWKCRHEMSQDFYEVHTELSGVFYIPPQDIVSCCQCFTQLPKRCLDLESKMMSSYHWCHHRFHAIICCWNLFGCFNPRRVFRHLCTLLRRTYFLV